MKTFKFLKQDERLLVKQSFGKQIEIKKICIDIQYIYVFIIITLSYSILAVLSNVCLIRNILLFK